jgi:hypothetical protein
MTFRQAKICFLLERNQDRENIDLEFSYNLRTLNWRRTSFYTTWLIKSKFCFVYSSGWLLFLRASCLCNMFDYLLSEWTIIKALWK